MKTILVPTDFSTSAKSAALYAIALAKDLMASKIVLYNAYQAPVIAEPTMQAMPSVQLVDFDAFKDISRNGLNQFKMTLIPFVEKDIEVVTESEYAVLPNNINEVCERTGADLIVLGINGGSKLEEMMIGSTATSIASVSTTPVIIVPEGATYHAIKNVMLACDFKKVEETTPVASIKKILDATNAQFHVVNVGKDHKNANDKTSVEVQRLQGFFEKYNPQFHFLSNDNFIEAINDFALQNMMDLIITIPKKHGLFDGLFRERHTKQLAFHSNVALMSIHEEH